MLDTIRAGPTVKAVSTGHIRPRRQWSRKQLGERLLHRGSAERCDSMLATELTEFETGAELVDPVLDVIRAQAEGADSLQGFQLLHCDFSRSCRWTELQLTEKNKLWEEVQDQVSELCYWARSEKSIPTECWLHSPSFPLPTSLKPLSNRTTVSCQRITWWRTAISHAVSMYVQLVIVPGL